MANRYGRNQKRKARALLEAAMKEHELQKRMNKAAITLLEMRFKKVASGYEVILELIRNTLGPSALLRVIATEQLPVVKPYSMHPNGQPTKMFEPPKPIVLSGVDSAAKAESINVHELYDLITHFSGSFESQMIARVQYRSGESCMALNEQAFKACPDYMLVRKISDDLLRHLRRQL